MRKTYIIITLFLTSLTTFSQSLKSKDDVFAQLMVNPGDTILWESYMGKTWNTMTIFEKEQCETLSERLSSKLKEQLTQIEKEKQESFTDNFDAEADSIEMTAEKLLQNDILAQERELQKQAKEAADASIAELKELSQNLKANLPIIEDMIQSKTSELGIAYQKYNSENSEEIIAWLKNYGQQIYKKTYSSIVEKGN
ncbi:hypothetical protein [Flammeovirga agarivorans]|uniref:Uncharacterized protein n=1 Tax=Flammeovirga agarivorans TaxID=2726742 RepID=A0A7X8SLZ7_9BACT|nr:hypothetical protein [Flammeovirga agarivorans]NLR92683.1 hypothetical protein [Flammeovirga agarivorans]